MVRMTWMHAACKHTHTEVTYTQMHVHFCYLFVHCPSGHVVLQTQIEDCLVLGCVYTWKFSLIPCICVLKSNLYY